MSRIRRILHNECMPRLWEYGFQPHLSHMETNLRNNDVYALTQTQHIFRGQEL